MKEREVRVTQVAGILGIASCGVGMSNVLLFQFNVTVSLIGMLLATISLSYTALALWTHYRRRRRA